jgi:membrane-bound metal-dependent hydrolase YbcI (DUF457 family)
LLGAAVAASIQRPDGPRRWGRLCVGAFLGICPDFDYALNWARISGGGWHHGFTHSVLFSLVLGSVAAAAFGEKKARSLVLFAAAAASHVLLDYLFTESRGVALWWPFTKRRFKLDLPNPVDYWWGNSTLWEAAAGVLRISLVELAMFGPLLLAVLLLKRRRVE